MVNDPENDTGIAAAREQVTEVDTPGVPVHANPEDPAVKLRYSIPAGNVSTIVVVPFAAAFAVFATVNVYVPVPVPGWNRPVWVFTNDRSGFLIVISTVLGGVLTPPFRSVA